MKSFKIGFKKYKANKIINELISSSGWKFWENNCLNKRLKILPGKSRMDDSFVGIFGKVITF